LPAAVGLFQDPNLSIDKPAKSNKVSSRDGLLALSTLAAASAILFKILKVHYSTDRDMSTTTARSEWFRLWYFLPIIVPAVIIIAFVVFYRVFLMCPTIIGDCSPLNSALLSAAKGNSGETNILKYVAKALWTLVNGVHALACLAAFVTSALIIYQALSTHRHTVRLGIIVVLFLVAVDVSLLVALWANGDVGAPATQLLRATIATASGWILLYTRLTDALSLTAALFLCFAATAILWKHDVNRPNDAPDLARRMKLLRYVLYMGAVLLVIGVLRLSTTLNWGASFLPPQSEAGKAVASVVTGIVSSLGTFYTLLMAGMYLPAALVLRARARELAELQPPADQQSWLTKHGLTLSYTESLPRIVAILAPLLAGPFIDIIKRLVGAPGG
jgi:hypothetical protein